MQSTEQKKFMIAYLLGKHNAERRLGSKLWDTELYQVAITKLEVEEAQYQYHYAVKNRLFEKVMGSGVL